MKFTSIYLFTCFGIFESYTFVIPEEFSSLVGAVSVMLPTIKKGTDSRLGWGFRIGRHADFQVLVELGPQTNTQPLLNQQDNTSRKRNIANPLRNFLDIQRQKNVRKQKKFEENITELNLPAESPLDLEFRGSDMKSGIAENTTSTPKVLQLQKNSGNIAVAIKQNNKHIGNKKS